MHYRDLSDYELLQCCREDNIRAYDVLFNRYAPKLYKLATRYIKDTALAEELMMDMLFNFWQKRNQLTITGDISAYLFRSMRNLVIDQLRKDLPVHASVDLFKECSMQSKSADHDLLTAEADRFYHEKLSALSPQRLKVFKLSREENMTYSEIAQEMNLSVSTVENYIVVTLAILRKSVKEYATSATALIYLIFF